MPYAIILSLWMVSSPGSAHADRAGARFAPVNDGSRLSFACNFMLSNTKAVGRRVDGYLVGKELAVPREQVGALINSSKPEVLSLTQRFLARIKSLILPKPAAPSPELNVVIPNVQNADVSPQVRAVLERVGARLEQIQADTTTQADSNFPIRHVLRGRKQIQRYITKLAINSALLEKKLSTSLDAQPSAVPAVIEIPDVRVALATEPTDDAGPIEAMPEPKFIDHSIFRLPGVDMVEFKERLKVMGWGGAAGLAMVSIFAVDPTISVPAVATLGAGLVFASSSVRNQLGEMVGGVKSLYRDLRYGKPPKALTPAEVLAARVARAQIQLDVYNQISKRLAGTETENGFSYFSYEAEVPKAGGSGTRSMLVEHIIYQDGTSHFMVTVTTDRARKDVQFTQLDLH